MGQILLAMRRGPCWHRVYELVGECNRQTSGHLMMSMSWSLEPGVMWQKGLERCEGSAYSSWITEVGPGKSQASSTWRRGKKSQEVSKMQEGTTSPGVQVSSRSWRRQRNGFPPGASKRNTALLKPDFIPGKTILDFWPLELSANKCVWF